MPPQISQHHYDDEMCNAQMNDYLFHVTKYSIICTHIVIHSIGNQTKLSGDLYKET